MNKILLTKGNILESDTQALVNTVNTVGVMGKGIALQFKKAFPNNYKAYVKACKLNEVMVGKMYVTKDQNLTSGEKIIINFPTKKHWRKPSEYSYIEKGLDDLIDVIKKHEIKSISIPPLGSGNGGLDWNRVKNMIINKLNDIDVEVILYEPTVQVEEKLKKERVKLTEARALLLYVLFDLVRNGEYVSEFSSEKVAYFLQKFGAKKYFNLSYTPNFYGPYSGKVKHVLYALNGSYIMGYSAMDKKPFELLTLIPDGFETVEKIILEDEGLKLIATKTISFLKGFYSDFGLELLSSVDYLTENLNTFDKDKIREALNKWSDRKSKFSNDHYLSITLKHLHSAEFIV